jgi:hypothetical protein
MGEYYLTSYFDRSNIDNEVVKALEQSFIDQGNRMTSFGLEQVRIDDATPRQLQCIWLKM